MWLWLTVVRDDGPGHSWGVDLANHPEHAEPAKVLAPFLSCQHLREVGEDDGHRPANPAKGSRWVDAPLTGSEDEFVTFLKDGFLS